MKKIIVAIIVTNMTLLSGCFFESLFYPLGTYDNLIDPNNNDDSILVHANPNKTANVFIHAWNDNNFDIQEQMNPVSGGWYDAEIYASEFSFIIDFEGGQSSEPFHVNQETWVKRVTNGTYTAPPLGAPDGSSFNVYFNKPDSWTGIPHIVYDVYDYEMSDLGNNWYALYIYAGFTGNISFYDSANNVGNYLGSLFYDDSILWVVADYYWYLSYSYPGDGTVAKTAVTNNMGLYNGNFESWIGSAPEAWDFLDGEYCTNSYDRYVSFSQSCRISNTSANYSSMSRQVDDMVNINQDNDYIFGIFLRNDFVDQYIYFTIEIYNSVTNHLQTYNSSVAYYGDSSYTWKEISAYVNNLPSDSTYAKITIQINKPGGTPMDIYFDDAYAKEVIWQ